MGLISLGIDFGSIGSHAAVVIDGQIISLPIERWCESHPGWITFEYSTSAIGGPMQFTSIKYCIEKAQPVQTLLGRERPANLVVRLLQEIRKLAEFYADGGKIDQTVIAVPAIYSESRRSALLAAAKQAGLDQTSLINDALAAAMNLALQQPKDSISLIYNAGYTRCEIAIVRQTRRQFRALAYGGSDRLCGRILDDSIFTGCIRALQDKGVELGNLQPEYWLRLYQTAQAVKEQLNNLVDVHVQVITGGVEGSFFMSFRQPKFEAHVEQLTRDNFGVISDTIRDANLTLQDISQVIVTGGTTKLKVVQRMLNDYFAGNHLQITTDDALARGAAAFAADLIGTKGIDSSSASPKGDVDIASHIGVDFLSPEEVKGTSSLFLNVNPDEGQTLSPAEITSLVLRLSGSLPDMSALWSYIRTLGPTTAQKFLETLKDETEQQLQNMTQTTPRRNWRIQKAHELLAQGKYDEAVQESHLALASNVDNYQVLADMIDIHRLAAECTQTIEGYDDAIRWLKCARTHDQSDIESLNMIANRHLLHARQLVERGNFADALSAVKACLAVTGGDLEALELRKILKEKLRSTPES